MKKNFLNIIIFVSVVGILIISIRDYYLSKKSTGKKVYEITPSINVTNQITQAPINNDPEIRCQNRYFNFNKGTVWQYKSTVEINIQGKKQLINNFITSKIIEASPSSIIIETLIDKQKNPENKQTSILTCKKSGIYGLPFSLSLPGLQNQTGLQNQLFSFYKFDKFILFLPPEQNLKKNSQWPTTIKINPTFPLSLSELKIIVNNRIVNEEKKSILQSGLINILSVDSSIDLNQSILKELKLTTGKIFEYQLGENVGFLNFRFNLKSQELGVVIINLKLIDYTLASNIF